MALKGTNQEFGRPYNRRVVLEAVRLHGPIQRGAIAKRVGLTFQTVSNITRELENLDFIVGRRLTPRGRGLPATDLVVNPDGGFAIGLHLTPLGLEAALINLAGEVLAREVRRLARLSPEMAFSEIAAVVKTLRQGLSKSKRLLGVGLAMPGPFDVETMSFVGPTTLEGWRGVPVQERLSAIAGTPAFIEVDHAAAALGERLYGSGRNLRDFYYLYFGVGLGGCFVHDGLPLRGSHKNAGEIGHIPVVPEGEPCPCGNRGCLERYVSLEALQRRSAAVGVAGWTAEAAPRLRAAISTIENLFDPETVILGGLAEPELLATLIAAAEPWSNTVSSRKDRTAPRVMLSANGQDAVLRGAAALAVSGVLSPRFGQMFAAGGGRDERDPMLRTGEAA